MLVFWGADGQAEVIAGVRKAIEEVLEIVVTLNNQSCIVGKQNVSEENLVDFGFRSESGKIEKFTISAGAEKTPEFVVLKAFLRGNEKKIPKKVGASTQPCLTPQRILIASDMLPSNRTVPCMLLWKDSRKVRSFGEQPIGGRILKRSSLLTRSSNLQTTLLCA